MNERLPLTLASLPLLQGISAVDISHFLSENATSQTLVLSNGEILSHQGETCQHLTFLLEGTLKSSTEMLDYGYRFAEFLSAPMLIEPDILYGIQRQFGSTYESVGTTHIFLIPKSAVNRMLSSLEVFRLNYLNMLSTIAIRRRQSSQPIPTPDLRSRIKQFFAVHATTPAGTKTFSIRMSDLARMLGVSRGLISAELHCLETQGLLNLERSLITIPRFEDLI